MNQSVSHDVSELALKLLEGLGNTRALTVAILVRYGEWDTLSTLKCDPAVYCDAAEYAKSAAATSFLRKCEDLPTSFDRRQVAIDNWWKGERSCFKSNERLAPYLNRVEGGLILADDDFRCDARLLEFFRNVRKTILNWIGPSPHALTRGRFGPGSTYSDKEPLTTVPDKMSIHPSLTRNSIWYLPQWLGTQWGAHCASKLRSPVFVRGNRFSTAPKDATKFRAIAAEPSINVFYQLGLGSELRQAMKRIGVRPSSKKYGWGVDLNHSQEIHKRVACEASRDGRMATLDLSNASDSVCYNLVKLCMPRLWFQALEALRSPMTQFPEKGRPNGRWVRLEKFSSMGNGFTFELETLLFLAISQVALESEGFHPLVSKHVYVYGDDIIVPTAGVKVVIGALRFCGFELNSDKSFTQGDFRESCGGDYFSGQPVRPFFLKEQPYEPQHWIVIANGLRALSASLASPCGFAMVQRAWFHCLDMLPRAVRSCRGPTTFGDLVVHDGEQYWATRKRGKMTWIRCYRPHKHREVSYGNFHPNVILACATYGLGWGNGAIRPRDSVLSYKCGWVALGLDG